MVASPYGRKVQYAEQSQYLVRVWSPSVRGLSMCGAAFPKGVGLQSLKTRMMKALPTPFASQTRTVRSDEAVYSTPLPLSPPPPHRTTFTLAVWPPKVYSRRRVAMAHTFTVASLEEDASRGDVGFLIRVSHPVVDDKTGGTHVNWFPGQRRDPLCVSL
jgi:hypothetical protein